MHHVAHLADLYCGLDMGTYHQRRLGQLRRSNDKKAVGGWLATAPGSVLRRAERTRIQ